MKRLKVVLAICLLAGLLVEGTLRAQGAKAPSTKPDDITDIIKIQASNSKTDINNYVGKVYTFKHPAAGDIFHIFQKAAAKEGGSAESVASINGVVVRCPAHMIPYFDRVAKQLDVKGVKRSSGKKRFPYVCKNRPAATLEHILENAAAGITSNIQDAKSIVSDAEINQLHVVVTPANIKVFKEFIPKIDVPVPQVDIVAKIVEIDTHDGGKLGIDWGAWKRHISGGWTWSHGKSKTDSQGSSWIRQDGKAVDADWDPAVDATYFGDAFYRGSGYASANGTALLLSMDAGVLADMLNYTIQEGKGRVLTEAQVTCRNRQAGTVDSMTRIPFYGASAATSDGHHEATANFGAGTGYPRRADNATMSMEDYEDASLATANSTPDISAQNDFIASLALAEEGVRMVVTPTIGTQTTRLDIALTVNSMVGWSKIETPIIHTRYIETEVVAEDGKMISMGGLSKKTNNNDVDKIPGLGSIPYLGYLFKTETQVKKESVIFAFIKPKLKNVSVTGEQRSVLEDTKDATSGGSIWGYDDFGYTE